MSTETIADPFAALRTLAATHLEEITEQRRAKEEFQRENAARRAELQAQGAVRSAAAFTREQLPKTLHRVLAETDWTGYPELPGQDTRTAVAAMGQGVWAVFHYSPVSDNEMFLVVPCPCGKYAVLPAGTDEALALVLADVAVWHADTVACSHRCTRSSGSAPRWLACGGS